MRGGNCSSAQHDHSVVLPQRRALVMSPRLETKGLRAGWRWGIQRAMATPTLILRDIHLRFGAQPLLDGAELFVSPGDRICLVGRNGSGKSTLLKVAARMIEPESGRGVLPAWRQHPVSAAGA